MSGSCESLDASPVFKKASGHPRKQSSAVPVDPTQLHCDADTSVDVSGRDSPNVPISTDARQNHGLTGTLGGSVGAGELDAGDPDSNIPGELQVILSSSDQEIDDTLSSDHNVMIVWTSLSSPGHLPKMLLSSPKGQACLACGDMDIIFWPPPAHLEGAEMCKWRGQERVTRSMPGHYSTEIERPRRCFQPQGYKRRKSQGGPK